MQTAQNGSIMLKDKTMRNHLVSIAIAASLVGISAPAAAQRSQPDHRGQVGHNNFGQVRSLQVRIDAVQRQIVRLDQRRVLSNREARDLRNEALSIEQRLNRATRSGLSRQERANIDQRIDRLEQRVRREANDRNRR